MPDELSSRRLKRIGEEYSTTIGGRPAISNARSQVEIGLPLNLTVCLCIGWSLLMLMLLFIYHKGMT